jgi:hypothetical protein
VSACVQRRTVSATAAGVAAWSCSPRQSISDSVRRRRRREHPFVARPDEDAADGNGTVGDQRQPAGVRLSQRQPVTDCVDGRGHRRDVHGGVPGVGAVRPHAGDSACYPTRPELDVPDGVVQCRRLCGMYHAVTF